MVTMGEVDEAVTLHCGNVSGPRGLVSWYRSASEPVLLVSSNSSLPPASARFSLWNTSSLHIEALSLQDEGNYTCQETLNETQQFQVWLQVASKWGCRAWDSGCKRKRRAEPGPCMGFSVRWPRGFILHCASWLLSDL